MERFFESLENLQAEHGCFHDIRHSLHIIQAMGLPEEEADSLLDWCEHGGYCDCEIASNTYEYCKTIVATPNLGIRLLDILTFS
ncbi:DUF2695 domain-containing protein [Azonexus sp.]|uniref:DUF2695 domain-containing protein n=1 Tax=Azonexus sp. TaxID=1872668 RepID=UPI0028245606|nr:DUF2695 domain-containing protein [Azonexus sp.]